ncbi:hypothetical protein [Caballeronia sp. GAFFF2]|uniref:hypothetical protein n=1 Tax=Caballeronia sp. GAFFF2 TaxID=2921741 RepID=UPI002027E48B|nr:hypothetical protein [Caballeronia sp. GAFFF2]
MDSALFLQLLFTFLVAGGGAYFGSYIREKGKSLATKEDIGKITAIVEKVRTEVNHLDWTKREWTNLRRIKLEELLNHVHETERFLTSAERCALDGTILDATDPRPELETIETLYFPELRPEMKVLLAVVSDRVNRSSQMAVRVRQAINSIDMNAQKAAFEQYSRERDLAAYILAVDALRKAAARVLTQILPPQ